MQVVLYCLIESIRQIGILIQPFMPDTAFKILDNLSVETNSRNLKDLNKRIKPNTVISITEQLFPRINEN